MYINSHATDEMWNRWDGPVPAQYTQPSKLQRDIAYVVGNLRHGDRCRADGRGADAWWHYGESARVAAEICGQDAE